MDQWLDFSAALGPGSSLETACTIANEFLALRTFLVGYRLSLADLACWGQLAGERGDILRSRVKLDMYVGWHPNGCVP